VVCWVRRWNRPSPSSRAPSTLCETSLPSRNPPTVMRSSPSRADQLALPAVCTAASVPARAFSGWRVRPWGLGAGERASTRSQSARRAPPGQKWRGVGRVLPRSAARRVARDHQAARATHSPSRAGSRPGDRRIGQDRGRSRPTRATTRMLRSTWARQAEDCGGRTCGGEKPSAAVAAPGSPWL
jgi:hypothetical protein